MEYEYEDEEVSYVSPLINVSWRLGKKAKEIVESDMKAERKCRRER